MQNKIEETPDGMVAVLGTVNVAAMTLMNGRLNPDRGDRTGQHDLTLIEHADDAETLIARLTTDEVLTLGQMLVAYAIGEQVEENRQATLAAIREGL